MSSKDAERWIDVLLAPQLDAFGKPINRTFADLRKASAPRPRLVKTYAAPSGHGLDLPVSCFRDRRDTPS